MYTTTKHITTLLLRSRVKSWHLHLQKMSQNRKFVVDDFELLSFFSSNDRANKNVFGKFGWFSRVELQMLHFKKKFDVKISRIVKNRYFQFSCR